MFSKLQGSNEDVVAQPGSHFLRFSTAARGKHTWAEARGRICRFSRLQRRASAALGRSSIALQKSLFDRVSTTCSASGHALGARHETLSRRDSTSTYSVISS